MTQSSLQRILRQFGAGAYVNEKRMPKDQLKARNPKPKPLELGFKALPHAEKMAAKKAHRAQLASMAYRDPSVRNRIASMVNAVQGMNRRNGVGRPPLYKRFLVRGAA